MVDTFGDAANIVGKIKFKNKKRKEISPTIIAGDSISNGQMGASNS